MKMMAAIYARYSSENQRPESIEDQISSCRKLATERGYSVFEEYVYFDKAASGARKDRPGLDALMAESETGCFGVVLVDDLSRLARDNFLMLSLMAELRFNGVSVVSVADGLDSEDEESNLGIQIRGIFNELQLRDLRKKTLRGQIGQKERGFSVGERTFGYKSIPVGYIRVDKKGRPRPEGYKSVIEPREADIVLRIFRDFAEGNSQTRLVQRLNEENIPGRLRTSKGWSPGTVGRILRNEKYVGRWVWNRTESRRDPKTGRRRRFPKPEAEWIIRHEEALRIVPQSLWDAVQRRIAETSRTWPGGKGKRGFETQRGGRVEHYPTHLLSGSMICGACGAAIAQVSGKSGGYYGCLAAAKGACENRLLVRRTLCERLILARLWDKLSPPENLQYVIKRVEEEIANSQSGLPDILRIKSAELETVERRISNFVEFIGEGRGSQALAEALSLSEQRAQNLRAEVGQLKGTESRAFKPPSEDWLRERISELQELLERRTQRSGLILRKLLGKIRLEPTRGITGKPYYVAVSALNMLPLIDENLAADALQQGSNTLRWWRRRESNPRPRTFSSRSLHAYPEVCFSSGKTLSGGFPSRPAR
jgi:site-specific DNA recombinase